MDSNDTITKDDPIEDEVHDDHSPTASAGDDVLIESLAHGASYAEAGKAAGVSARTVSRRLEEPTFLVRLQERRLQVDLEHVALIRKLGAMRITAAVQAQQVLLELLEDDDPKTRLAAAKELHSGASVAKHIGHEERLLRLEGRFEEPGAPRPPRDWTL